MWILQRRGIGREPGREAEAPRRGGHASNGHIGIIVTSFTHSGGCPAIQLHPGCTATPRLHSYTPAAQLHPGCAVEYAAPGGQPLPLARLPPHPTAARMIAALPTTTHRLPFLSSQVIALTAMLLSWIRLLIWAAASRSAGSSDGQRNRTRTGRAAKIGAARLTTAKEAVCRASGAGPRAHVRCDCPLDVRDAPLDGLYTTRGGRRRAARPSWPQWTPQRAHGRCCRRR
jgi:hypothetical protein